MNNVPLVSIVIPTYEQDEQVLQAVRSALAQDYPRLEIIVVDDASPSAGYEAVRAMADSRLRYVRRTNNIGRTENYRLSLRDIARGDWAMMLDGDDYLTDDQFISSAIQAANSDPTIVIIAARSETRSSDEVFVSDHPGNCTVPGLDVLRSLPDPRFFLQHLAVLYRRPEAVALDFYRSPAISSDWESLYRLASHGKVYFLDRVVGVWRIHNENASGSRELDGMIGNLAIWGPVYAEAVAQGLPAVDAERCRLSVVKYMMRQHVPKVAHSWPTFRAYLGQLKRDQPEAIAGLANGLTLVRLALALTGYYRKR